jgi:hypothetical protein
VPDSLYRVDWVKSLLIFKPGMASDIDSIRIDYDVYPLDLSKTYRHKSPDFNRISPQVYQMALWKKAVRPSDDKINGD